MPKATRHEQQPPKGGIFLFEIYEPDGSLVNLSDFYAKQYEHLMPEKSAVLMQGWTLIEDYPPGYDIQGDESRLSERFTSIIFDARFYDKQQYVWQIDLVSSIGRQSLYLATEGVSKWLTLDRQGALIGKAAVPENEVSRYVDWLAQILRTDVAYECLVEATEARKFPGLKPYEPHTLPYWQPKLLLLTSDGKRVFDP